jgi:hypothetical protein
MHCRLSMHTLHRESWFPSLVRYNMSAAQHVMCSERQKKKRMTAVPILSHYIIFVHPHRWWIAQIAHQRWNCWHGRCPHMHTPANWKFYLTFLDLSWCPILQRNMEYNIRNEQNPDENSRK